VSDPIVMAQAFAELRYGVVIHTRENSVKYGHNFTTKPFTEGYTAHGLARRGKIRRD
jgi:hypothetical protein